MARTKKNRSAEVSAVFNGLQYCSATELNQIKEKCEALMKAKKAEAIKEKEAQIEALKKELEALKK